jgi:hypothetical protein
MRLLPEVMSSSAAVLGMLRQEVQSKYLVEEARTGEAVA